MPPRLRPPSMIGPRLQRTDDPFAIAREEERLVVDEYQLQQERDFLFSTPTANMSQATLWGRRVRIREIIYDANLGRYPTNEDVFTHLSFQLEVDYLIGNTAGFMPIIFQNSNFITEIPEFGSSRSAIHIINNHLILDDSGLLLPEAEANYSTAEAMANRQILIGNTYSYECIQRVLLSLGLSQESAREIIEHYKRERNREISASELYNILLDIIPENIRQVSNEEATALIRQHAREIIEEDYARAVLETRDAGYEFRLRELQYDRLENRTRIDRRDVRAQIFFEFRNPESEFSEYDFEHAFDYFGIEADYVATSVLRILLLLDSRFYSIPLTTRYPKNFHVLQMRLQGIDNSGAALLFSRQQWLMEPLTIECLRRTLFVLTNSAEQANHILEVLDRFYSLTRTPTAGQAMDMEAVQEYQRLIEELVRDISNEDLVSLTRELSRNLMQEDYAVDSDTSADIFTEINLKRFPNDGSEIAHARDVLEARYAGYEFAINEQAEELNQENWVDVLGEQEFDGVEEQPVEQEVRNQRITVQEQKAIMNLVILALQRGNRELQNRERYPILSNHLRTHQFRQRMLEHVIRGARTNESPRDFLQRIARGAEQVLEEMQRQEQITPEEATRARTSLERTRERNRSWEFIRATGRI